MVDKDSAEEWFIQNVGKTRLEAFDPFNQTRSFAPDSFITSVDADVTCSTPGYRTPLFFGVQDLQNSKQGLTITKCFLGTTYVDILVECDGSASIGKMECGVAQVRKMLNPPSPPEYSLIDGCIYYPNGE